MKKDAYYTVEVRKLFSSFSLISIKFAYLQASI